VWVTASKKDLQTRQEDGAERNLYLTSGFSLIVIRLFAESHVTVSVDAHQVPKIMYSNPFT
jgi:hypothetical protein